MRGRGPGLRGRGPGGWGRGPGGWGRGAAPGGWGCLAGGALALALHQTLIHRDLCIVVYRISKITSLEKEMMQCTYVRCMKQGAVKRHLLVESGAS